MGRLKRLSGYEVIKILERQGFSRVRQRGSHVILQKQKPTGGTITVPVPDHRELKVGTLLGIIDQCQLPRALFEADE